MPRKQARPAHRCKRKRHGMPWRFFFGGLTAELL
jgi:hypothetical protein